METLDVCIWLAGYHVAVISAAFIIRDWIHRRRARRYWAAAQAQAAAIIEICAQMSAERVAVEMEANEEVIQ